MKNIFLIILFTLSFSARNAQAQYAMHDTWYNNPLGFAPLNLHTSMGFLVPAATVALCLALTGKDSSLHHRFSISSTAGWAGGYKYPATTLS
ncbi:hypothetical protein GCM10023093_24800 [Nemorincola caseinilytica]|uniref:Uncharacterized protein n=1 Tax=Nemorincola caseinilytica TaxID=2054315 RepID=A0ABP8NIR5_9BACT